MPAEPVLPTFGSFGATDTHSKALRPQLQGHQALHHQAQDGVAHAGTNQPQSSSHSLLALYTSAMSSLPLDVLSGISVSWIRTAVWFPACAFHFCCHRALLLSLSFLHKSPLLATLSSQPNAFFLLLQYQKKKKAPPENTKIGL